MEFVTKKEQRLKYLKVLYDMVGGSPLQAANHHAISLRAGLSHRSSRDAFYYLQNEGLLKAQNPVGAISITHQGVKEYEATITRTNQEPVHCPARSIMGKFLHIETRDESVKLYGSPVERLAATQMVGSSTNLPEGDLVPLPETEKAKGETQFQTRKSKKHLIIAVIQNLKRALTNSLFETGVRFLLSKLRRLL